MILEITIILLVISLVLNTMKRPKCFPPGPPVFPIVENWLHTGIKSPNAAFMKLHKKFEDIGLMLYPYKFIVLGNANLIKEMLNNPLLSERPVINTNTDRFDGKNLGIIFIGGDTWAKSRQFVLSSFRNLGVGKKQNENTCLEEISHLADSIKECNGQPVNLIDLLALANLNVAWKLLAGDRLNLEIPEHKATFDALLRIPRYMSILGNWSMIMPFLQRLFPKATKREEYVRDNRIISLFVKETIAKHKENRERERPRDLIDIYLNEVESSDDKSIKEICEDQLEAIVIDVMEGGTDTTSTQLSYAVMFLALYPDIQKKIYDEVISICGANNFPTLEDVPRFTYAKAFLNEVLRTRPPTPITMHHRATKDTKIGNYFVPKDTLVVAHLERAFMHEKFWERPQVFEPERFINSDGNFHSPDHFFPFGKGKRKCLGETISKLSSTLIITHLVRHFVFQIPKNLENVNTKGTTKFLLGPPEFEVVAKERSSRSCGKEFYEQ